MIANFAAIAITLYVAHHVGDYWVQRHVDALHKGDPGRAGRLHCLHHVCTYLFTQTVFFAVITWSLHLHTSTVGYFVGLAISGVTHYIADRRKPLERIVSWIPGKLHFLELGRPRKGVRLETWEDCSSCQGRGTSTDSASHFKCWDCQGGGEIPFSVGDNPQLATGLWALDQSWHIFWGVFVTALVMVTL